jgi:glycosyltransferase involved in cell wall biosynthesis
MNICLVNNIFPPIETGSSMYTRDLARLLSLKGHHVIVITSGFESLPEMEKSPEGYTVYRLNSYTLPRLRIWHYFPNFTFNLTRKNIKRFKEILLQEKVQLIHQCNNIFDLVFVSAYFSKKLNIPLFTSLTTQIQHRNKTINKFLEIFDRTVVKYFFARHIKIFFALDKESLRYINERYNRYKDIVLIPFSVPDLSSFFNIDRDYTKNYGVIISLGHLSENKDRRELILSLPKVKQKVPNLKIKIIGEIFSEQPMKFASAIKVENDLIFTGKVSHSEIPEIIKHADIGSVVISNLPYHRGVGTANLELMASGLPVILDAYDNNFGEAFPFKNGVHYIQLESRDPDWVSDKIIELYEHPEMRERIGKAGKEFVTDQLTWARIIPMIEAAYLEAIGQNNE